PARQTIQIMLPNGEYQYMEGDPYISMSIRYSTIGDVFFITMPPYAAEAFQYETLLDGNMTVTPIIGVNDGGSRNLETDKTTPFYKIW
ncbi:MAG: hypothetical protein LBP89_07365, partial [Helicobacteraceae bacterium]|nr:hypothetical protein [Helicobacteraceae bacterium]